jgi:hypothetical protein
MKKSEKKYKSCKDKVGKQNKSNKKKGKKTVNEFAICNSLKPKTRKKSKK